MNTYGLANKNQKYCIYKSDTRKLAQPILKKKYEANKFLSTDMVLVPKTRHSAKWKRAMGVMIVMLFIILSKVVILV